MQKTVYLELNFWWPGALREFSLLIFLFFFFRIQKSAQRHLGSARPEVLTRPAAWLPFSSLRRTLQSWGSSLHRREGIWCCSALLVPTMNVIYRHSWAHLSSWVSATAELTVCSLRPGTSVVLFKAVSTDHRWGRRHPRSPASKQLKDCRSLRITHLTTQFFFFLMLPFKKKFFSIQV